MQEELRQKKHETLHIIAYLADQVRQIDDKLNGNGDDNKNEAQQQHNCVECNGQDRKA